MSAKAQTATGEQAETSGTQGIPEEHRADMNSCGHYGRPQYKVGFYSEQINARAMATFETRHEAVGYVAQATREGWMKRPAIGYRESYDSTPSKHYK